MVIHYGFDQFLKSPRRDTFRLQYSRYFQSSVPWVTECAKLLNTKEQQFKHMERYILTKWTYLIWRILVKMYVEVAHERIQLILGVDIRGEIDP